jgi:hypothetical protein
MFVDFVPPKWFDCCHSPCPDRICKTWNRRETMWNSSVIPKQSKRSPQCKCGVTRVEHGASSRPGPDHVSKRVAAVDDDTVVTWQWTSIPVEWKDTTTSE